MTQTAKLASMAALLVAFFLSIAAATDRESGLPVITLLIQGHQLTAEVAETDAEKSRGLMGRTELPPDHGMLFVWPRPIPIAMWMMNTPLPLSVAFLDSQGRIINIEDMEPHTTTPHHARHPARFALEMEQGWFAARGIGPGELVLGLPE